MCFEFSSCFGGGRKDDYGGERSNHSGCGGLHRARRGYRKNGNGYNAAADDHKPATAYDHQRALDEEGRKANHDGARKADHATVVAGASVHGYSAAYAPDKAHEKPKLPSSQNKASDDAGYADNTARFHQAAADHREHAAMDYHHHYPSTTTTLVR